jgi:HSP20 family protein
MPRSAIKVYKAKRTAPVEPEHPLTHRILEKLRSELDEAFDRFSDHFALPSLHRVFDLERRLRHRMPLSSIAAAVDVSEEEELFRISIELPGIDANGIELTVSDNTLAIKGEKKDDREKETRGYYLREREYGSFERFIEMPTGIDYDGIEAEFANGVLTIVLPKTPEAARKHKKVSVQSG